MLKSSETSKINFLTITKHHRLILRKIKKELHTQNKYQFISKLIYASFFSFYFSKRDDIFLTIYRST